MSDNRLVKRDSSFEGVSRMSRGKKHTPEQIICKLREAEVAISEGQTAALAAKSIGVTYLRPIAVGVKSTVGCAPTKRSV